jgi:hypothetical protein
MTESENLNLAIEPGESPGSHDVIVYDGDGQEVCRASLCALVHEYAEAMDDVEDDPLAARHSFAQFLAAHAAGLVTQLVVGTLAGVGDAPAPEERGH